MKDESPHLFRSLETVGPDGFDTIVGAAVATYTSLREPNAVQARDFGRLVAAVWDKISPGSRRSLAAALSRSPRVPRAIVDRLLVEPIDIAAPFLSTSPALTEADRDSLRRRGTPATGARTAHAPVVSPPGNAPSTLVPLADGLESEAPRSQRVAAEPAPMASPDATLSDALKRLALPGRRRKVRPASEERPSLPDLLALAVRQDAAGFFDGLGRALSLSSTVLGQIEGEASGFRLAVALKALQAGTADALTALMMLKPHIGLDVQAFEQMTRYYTALRPEDCAAITKASAGPDHREAVLQPQYQETEGLARAQERPQFGRRRQRPPADAEASRTKA